MAWDFVTVREIRAPLSKILVKGDGRAAESMSGLKTTDIAAVPRPFWVKWKDAKNR